MMRRVLATMLLSGSIISLQACDEQTFVDPAPVPTDAAALNDVVVDVASEAPEAAPDALPVEAGPVRRTVMTRSPFGNLSYTDNLLIDGDMEMSTGVDQTPWLALGAAGQESLSIETGGTCRSGLRCLVLDHRVDAAFGSGVAADDKPLEFWMWAKVPGNDCKVLSVYLFPRMTMHITMFHQVVSDSNQPDGDGWCRFHALRTAMDESVGVYVEAQLAGEQRIILDDAVLRAADGTSPTTLRSIPISKAEHARIVARIAPMLRLRPIGPWRPRLGPAGRNAN